MLTKIRPALLSHKDNVAMMLDIKTSLSKEEVSPSGINQVLAAPAFFGPTFNHYKVVYTILHYSLTISQVFSEY